MSFKELTLRILWHQRQMVSYPIGSPQRSETAQIVRELEKARHHPNVIIAKKGWTSISRLMEIKMEIKNDTRQRVTEL